MKLPRLIAVAAIFLSSISLSFAADEPSAIPEVPVKDMVTRVDVGADKCIPCKMMAPILQSLAKEYQGKAAILFVDVWKNPEQGRRFGIRSIPTQIFYDRTGKETYRHEGFLNKDSIVEKLEQLGVKTVQPAVYRDKN